MQNMIQLRKRDVVRHAGQEWVVDMVNECRARCIQLDCRSNVVSLSTRLEPECFVRRLDPSQFHAVTKNKNTETKKETEEMKTKTAKQDSKTSKSRASSRKTTPVTEKPAPTPAEATPAAASNDKGRGRLGGLLGFSVAAVCRTLGANGLKARQVQSLMDRLQIKVNPHTVHIQTGAGRNKNMSYGKPAELTKEQVQDLVAQIPAEEAAKN